MKRLSFVCLSAVCCTAAFAARTPAFTMRFDDNRDPRTWKAVCTSFDSRGLVCTLSVNCDNLSPAQWAFLREASAKGHEVLDHTPSHALYGMRLKDAAAFEKAKALPFVAAVDEQKRYLCFRPVVDPKHPKNTRRKLTVRDGVVEATGGKRSLGYYVNLLLPGRAEICSLKFVQDHYEVVDFWGRPLAEKINLTDAEVTFLDDLAIMPTPDQLRLMAKTSADAFAQAGLPPPRTWIRPGGWYPGIAWDALKGVYGDEFGYVCGDARPGAPHPGVLSVTDAETTAGRWSMCYDGYFFDQGPAITPEMVADHVQKRLAEGRSLVILSHLWANKLPGGMKEMLEKIDRLAQILAERKVPMCTHAELAVRTFGPPRCENPVAGAGRALVGSLGGISLDVPKVEPADVCVVPDLKSVWIEGEPCGGKPTKFFAYYGLPEGASAARPVPGMVLIHGGLGTAYASWVRTWVKRGYAAIAADNCAAIPKKVEGTKWDWTASGVGGPRGWGRDDLADRPPQEQWPYHAVATAIRSHSFLRSLPEVDAERTGVTGISWGGFLTMLTAGADNRFKFAAPVYASACYEGTNSRRHCKDERLWQKWHALWDPRLYVRHMRMPVVWSASTTDFFFPFDCLEKGFESLPNEPQLAIRVGMNHSHGPSGENVPEIFQMADGILRNGRAAPCVTSFSAADGRLHAVFDLKGHAIRGYDLCWTSSDGEWRERKWEVRRTPSTSNAFSCEIPAEARAAYVNLVLDEPTGETCYPESVVSTKAWFRPASEM